MGASGILGNADYFENNKQGTYVRISDDKRKAWLYLAPKDDDESYTKDDLKRLLVENGVLSGINESGLVAMAKKHVYYREIVVAEAEPEVCGSDGYYEFAFDVNSGTSKPVIREDGSVDYQSMRAVNSVQAGAWLATYHHAVPGKAGKDVCGNEITIPTVREIPSILGKGVYQGQDDPDKYYAEKEGKVEFNSGRLNIVNVLEFSGDVDQITGKIEFYGDIHILGSVEAGTVIRAGKSLMIDGTVEAADLYAGGDIVLKRGIQGSQKAHIVGKGNLYADFVEHSFVKVEGNVEANYVLSSYISAGGQVKLSGKKASLIGGNVYAKKGISCNTLGNSKEVKTKVSSGVTAEMLEENAKIQADIKAVKAKIEKIREDVQALGKRLTPELQESYKMKLQEQMAEQKALMEKQKEAFERIEEARDSTIVVNADVNLGCEICIDNNVLVIDKKNTSMEYRNIAGMITGKVVVYK